MTVSLHLQVGVPASTQGQGALPQRKTSLSHIILLLKWNSIKTGGGRGMHSWSYPVLAIRCKCNLILFCCGYLNQPNIAPCSYFCHRWEVQDYYTFCLQPFPLVFSTLNFDLTWVETIHGAICPTKKSISIITFFAAFSENAFHLLPESGADFFVIIWYLP